MGRGFASPQMEPSASEALHLSIKARPAWVTAFASLESISESGFV